MLALALPKELLERGSVVRIEFNRLGLTRQALAAEYRD